MLVKLTTENKSGRFIGRIGFSHQRLTPPQDIYSSDESIDREPVEDEWDPEHEIILDIWPPQNQPEPSCPSSISRTDQGQLDILEQDQPDVTSSVVHPQQTSLLLLESDTLNSEIFIEHTSADTKTLAHDDDDLDMIPIIDNIDSNIPADDIIDCEISNSVSEVSEVPSTEPSNLPSGLNGQERGQGICENPPR